MSESTLERMLKAAEQLSASERQQLADELNRLSTREKAMELFDRLRDRYLMPAAKQERMSRLLAKGNEGTLNHEESRELESLLEECDERTLQLTQEVARELEITSDDRSGRRSDGP